MLLRSECSQILETFAFSQSFLRSSHETHHLSIRYLLVTDLINDTGEMRPQRLEKILRVVFNHAFLTNVHDCTWGKVEVFLTSHDLNPSFFVGYSEFPTIYFGLGGLIFGLFFQLYSPQYGVVKFRRTCLKVMCRNFSFKHRNTSMMPAINF